jgi:hypothetical protein
VDPVPDPLVLRKSGSTWNRTPTSGSVARNSIRPQRRCLLTFYVLEMTYITKKILFSSNIIAMIVGIEKFLAVLGSHMDDSGNEFRNYHRHIKKINIIST